MERDITLLEGEKKGEKLNEGVIVVGAGLVLLIAGVKHALPTFLEQWRALVFLVLNVVVLTILFTSLHSSSRTVVSQASYINDSEMGKKKRRRRRSRSSVSISSAEEALTVRAQEKTLLTEQVKASKAAHQLVEEEQKDEKIELSKEELNKRADAFIVMFKQQLVLDAQEMRRHPVF